jgi:hypothetical protein
LAQLLIPNTTILRKVGVRASGTDNPTLRARFERALATVELHPSCIPPSAILCVRQVRDRSGRLTLRPDPDFAAVERWRQTVVSILDDHARHAARPAQEPVSAGADAVLFADEAELLACLALDWCRGSFPEHWWWLGLFPNGSRPHCWTAIWRQQPESIPAAVDLLTERRKLLLIAQSVDSNDARLLLAALVKQFGLREVALALARTGLQVICGKPDPTSGEIGRLQSSGNLVERIAITRDLASALPPEPPWLRWISEAELSCHLGKVEQCFFGLAVALRRDPRFARSAPFAESIFKWISGQPRSQGAPPAQPVNEKTLPGSGRVFAARESSGDQREKSFGNRADQRALATGVQVDEGLISPEPEVARRFADQAHQKDPPAPVRVGAPPVVRHDPHDASTSEPAAPGEACPKGHSPPDEDESLIPSTIVPDCEINTNFGGVFYLINVALQLGLYGDFTTPLQPGLALDIWDFLALTGRELAGDEFVADPLWPLLSQLTGRNPDNEAPGAGFEAPNRWELPLDWLQAFSEPSIWRMAAGTERFRVEHSEGFAIVDIPATSEDAGKEFWAATKNYPSPSGLEMLPFREGFGLVTPLRRWLDWICGYLRARLLRALGFSPGSEDALKPLLNEGARVAVTATQVSLFFSLAQHPVQIRLSGLDRDPGWVPAAGKRVLFFYD